MKGETDDFSREVEKNSPSGAGVPSVEFSSTHEANSSIARWEAPWLNRCSNLLALSASRNEQAREETKGHKKELR